jgi:hypothetical protein
VLHSLASRHQDCFGLQAMGCSAVLFAGCVAQVCAPPHLHASLVAIKEYPGPQIPKGGYAAHDPRGSTALQWIDWMDCSMLGVGTALKRVLGTFSGIDAVKELHGYQATPSVQSLRPSWKRKRGEQKSKAGERAKRRHTGPLTGQPMPDKYATQPPIPWDGTLTAPSAWPWDLSSVETRPSEAIELPLLAYFTKVPPACN